MVKIEMELTDIDYDYLIREYLPRVSEKLKESGSPLAGLMGSGLASTLLMGASNTFKEKMTAELINLGSARLAQKIEEVAAQNGIPGKVRSLRASAAEDPLPWSGQGAESFD